MIRYATNVEGAQCEIDPDQRRVDFVLSSLNLHCAKSVATPSIKITTFRSMLMRVVYLKRPKFRSPTRIYTTPTVKPFTDHKDL